MSVWHSTTLTPSWNSTPAPPHPTPPHPPCPLQVGAARFATGHYLDAAFLFKFMATSAELQDFLTLPAYDVLVACEYGPGGGAGAGAVAHSKM